MRDLYVIKGRHTFAGIRIVRAEDFLNLQADLTRDIGIASKCTGYFADATDEHYARATNEKLEIFLEAENSADLLFRLMDSAGKNKREGAENLAQDVEVPTLEKEDIIRIFRDKPTREGGLDLLRFFENLSGDYGNTELFAAMLDVNDVGVQMRHKPTEERFDETSYLIQILEDRTIDDELDILLENGDLAQVLRSQYEKGGLGEPFRALYERVGDPQQLAKTLVEHGSYHRAVANQIRAVQDKPIIQRKLFLYAHYATSPLLVAERDYRIFEAVCERGDKSNILFIGQAHPLTPFEVGEHDFNIHQLELTVEGDDDPLQVTGTLPGSLRETMRPYKTKEGINWQVEHKD